ncbi:MAG: GTP-dependent nucleic acid-binding protein [Bacillota bacterium]|jgi:GTP-binding protein YchF
MAAMGIGLVGLPNVGKSTLFNALTKGKAQAANYPFCTIDPNVGIVDVPDQRLDKLADLVKAQRTVRAQCTFVDIAGLVRGASKGEGLGNKFLGHIREVYAIVHLVRCFADEEIVHVDGEVDPLRDIENITLELIFADLEMVERRLERVERQKKTGASEACAEYESLLRIKQHLEEGLKLTACKLSSEEEQVVRSLNLLTGKPMLYVANLGDDETESQEYLTKIKQLAAKEGAEVLTLSAKLESELLSLPEEERAIFIQELGLKQTGLERMIAFAYKLLNLATYFTAGEKEARAWTIKSGCSAQEAAGVIHTDMERGFIRAEVISYEEFVDCGSYAVARERGLLRLEGKEYIVQDGDVMHFRFAV